MKTLLMMFALCACRNNAITVAHRIDPNAICNETMTTWCNGDRDTAVCTLSNHVVVSCTSVGCNKIADEIESYTHMDPR